MGPGPGIRGTRCKLGFGADRERGREAMEEGRIRGRGRCDARGAHCRGPSGAAEVRGTLRSQTPSKQATHSGASRGDPRPPHREPGSLRLSLLLVPWFSDFSQFSWPLASPSLSGPVVSRIHGAAAAAASPTAAQDQRGIRHGAAQNRLLCTGSFASAAGDAAAEPGGARGPALRVGPVGRRIGRACGSGPPCGSRRALVRGAALPTGGESRALRPRSCGPLTASEAAVR